MRRVRAKKSNKILLQTFQKFNQLQHMMHSFDEHTYNEILKSYNESDFEFFDLKNDLYYQLFYAYNDIESQEN